MPAAILVLEANLLLAAILVLAANQVLVAILAHNFVKGDKKVGLQKHALLPDALMIK